MQDQLAATLAANCKIRSAICTKYSNRIQHYLSLLCAFWWNFLRKLLAMSNNHQHQHHHHHRRPHHHPMSKYEHIESLIHGLHTAKNIAQPEQNFNPNQSHSHPYRSNVSNHSSQLKHMPPLSTSSSSSAPSPLAMIIDEDEFLAADDVKHTTVMGSHTPNPSSLTARRHTHTGAPKGMANDISGISIPAVMVNDVIEPLDLISTTQRRFSQLYLGLRRLSTSNTVG